MIEFNDEGTRPDQRSRRRFVLTHFGVFMSLVLIVIGLIVGFFVVVSIVMLLTKKTTGIAA
jgi:uncharacterized Tic20 family protein